MFFKKSHYLEILFDVCDIYFQVNDWGWLEVRLEVYLLCSWWIMKSFPDDQNVTKSNFYLQNFCINFGDCKCIKTQISPKKGVSNACPKTEQYV